MSDMPVQGAFVSSRRALLQENQGPACNNAYRITCVLPRVKSIPSVSLIHCLTSCPRSLALTYDMHRPRAALGRRTPAVGTRVPAALSLSLALLAVILYHCRSSAGVVLHNRSLLRYSSADSLSYQHYSHHKPSARRDTNHTARALTPRQLDPAAHARAEHRRCFACRAATSPDRPTRATSSPTSRITSGQLSVAESLALPTAGQPTLSACLRYWATSASLPCLRPRTLLLKRRLTLPRATP